MTNGRDVPTGDSHRIVAPYRDVRVLQLSGGIEVAHCTKILVEAGAGSGKTAIMAGRIAVMLAEGVPPREIAAVTFTELAASELLSRVHHFVTDLSAGHIAPELRVALPNGLSQAQRDNLATASTAIDEITCSTIHGFCQRLIKPYPAEADIDPGATVMDTPSTARTGVRSFMKIFDTFDSSRETAISLGLLRRIFASRRGGSAPPSAR